MSTMSEDRWNALREQIAMAGRPSAFAEIETHVLFTNRERDTALEQVADKVKQIATLQAQVADLQATVAELNAKLALMPSEPKADAPVTP
jgi:pyridoxine/pyridoxamine 5'-phosphate oxidase